MADFTGKQAWSGTGEAEFKALFNLKVYVSSWSTTMWPQNHLCADSVSYTEKHHLAASPPKIYIRSNGKTAPLFTQTAAKHCWVYQLIM